MLTYIHTDRQTGRQTYRQTDRQAGRQTDRQAAVPSKSAECKECRGVWPRVLVSRIDGMHSSEMMFRL